MLVSECIRTLLIVSSKNLENVRPIYAMRKNYWIL